MTFFVFTYQNLVKKLVCSMNLGYRTYTFRLGVVAHGKHRREGVATAIKKKVDSGLIASVGVQVVT